VKKTDAARHVRTTALARAAGQRTDNPDQHCQAIVLLDTGRWRRVHGKIQNMDGGYKFRGEGWLALTLPRHSEPDEALLGELLRQAKALDLTDLPESRELPGEMRLEIVHAPEIRWTWKERCEEVRAGQQAQEERWARHREQRRAAQELRDRLDVLAGRLDIESSLIDSYVDHSKFVVPADMLVGLLERLARAEGVEPTG